MIPPKFPSMVIVSSLLPTRFTCFGLLHLKLLRFYECQVNHTFCFNQQIFQYMPILFIFILLNDLVIFGERVIESKEHGPVPCLVTTFLASERGGRGTFTKGC